ncbi:MAG: nucleoside-diphosphate-sugar epimerase [Planctomycetota bacterium]|jgi:nucleoside-diphosphate-sugar epimerase
MGAATNLVRVLVTGAGGFLGGGVVKALLARGDDVCSLQRGDYPALDALGIDTIKGDIADKDAVVAASKDCHAIIHTAARAGVWGEYEDYYRSNVTGTLNVIEACRINNIQRLVYTSSPSIVFEGEDEDGIDETTPLPAHYLTNYQRTKAEAEKVVLAANNEKLATVALRPHLIFGPGDPHLAPRIIERAKKGKLRLVGKRGNLVDITFVDNAVSAHLLALDALHPGSNCSGKAYFISNDEPLPMADVVNRILVAAGLPEVSATVSPWLAYAVGATMEAIYTLLRLQSEPFMTRFIARQLACSHWYNITAAKRDLKYEALVSIDKGMQTLQQSLQENNEMG